MSYQTQARLARDLALLDRITACAASEGVKDPVEWAYSHQWELSAEPGWDAAYAYAVASGSETPGADEGVITDGMILAAVSSFIDREKAAN